MTHRRSERLADAAGLPAYAVARQAKRARYDPDTVHAILDQGMVGHLGFVADERPMVIPMAYARAGACLYLHGASKTRAMGLAPGVPACLTVTLLDGIVAARSAFNHSVNYRSVVVHGTIRPVGDATEKEEALRLITDHLLPGRWAEVRPMLDRERKATGVIALDIKAASAKVREGGPIDDEDDRELSVWGGVVPVVTALGQPVPDGLQPVDTPIPSSISAARRKFA